MTFFAPIPSVQERALARNGREAIRAIAAIQSSLGAPTVSAIQRRLGTTKHETHTILETLDAARLVTFMPRMAETLKAYLTDEGWKLAGGKPLWMTAE
jgi:hypothetical protein